MTISCMMDCPNQLLELQVCLQFRRAPLFTHSVSRGLDNRVCPSSRCIPRLVTLQYSSKEEDPANGGPSIDAQGSNKDDDEEEEMDEEDSEDVCILFLKLTNFSLTCKLSRKLKLSQTAPYNQSRGLL